MKKNNPILSILVFFFSIIAPSITFAQNWQYTDWLRQVTSTNSGECEINDVIEYNSKIYVVGSFSGTCQLPGSNTSFTASDKDAFIACYSSVGALDWGRQISGSGDQVAKAIVYGYNSDLFITGQDKDGLLLQKWNLYGTLLGTATAFNQSFDSYLLNNGNDIEVYGTNIYVLGSYSNSSISLLKFNSSLVYSNVNQIFPSTQTAEGLSMKRIASALYVTGYYSGNLTDESGSLIFSNYSSTANTHECDIYIGRFHTTSLANEWKLRAGGINGVSTGILGDRGYGIDVTTTAIYVTGASQSNSTQFTSASGTNSITLATHGIFVAKYTNTGQVQWVKDAGDGSLLQRNNVGYGIDEQAGKLYVVGRVMGGSQFAPGVSIPPATGTTGSDNVFLAEYNGTDGTLNNLQSSNNNSQNSALKSVYATTGCQLYVGGYFNGQRTFENLSVNAGTKSGLLLSLTKFHPSVAPSSFSFCKNSPLVLPLTASGATSYSWASPVPSLLTSTTGATVNFDYSVGESLPSSNSFAITVTGTKSGCSGKALVKVNQTCFSGGETEDRSQDIADLDSDINLQIFPNPATSEINVNIDSETEEPATFYLMDFSGRVIETQKTIGSSQTSKFALEHLPAGFYIVKLQYGENKTMTKSFIKQ